MFSCDFEKYFNCDGHLNKVFKGVYAYDRIPNSIKQGEFYICNTATSDSEGQHWFIVYRPVQTLLECFDSLGTPLDKRDIRAKHLKFRGIQKVKFNLTRVQADDAETCGQHCIYFIYQRIYNNDLNFKELLNESYSATDYNLNETNVKHLITELSL